jgi:hypothetical protein
MSKTFSFAGTCVVDGATVYKFANDANRAAVLTKLGATDVNIIQLPFAMGKEEAVEWLNGQGITATKPARSAKPKSAKAKTGTVTVRVKPAVAKGEPDLQEQYGEEMFERKANGMPTLTFAQWKRGRETAAKWFAKTEQKLQAKREAGKWFA